MIGVFVEELDGVLEGEGDGDSMLIGVGLKTWSGL